MKSMKQAIIESMEPGDRVIECPACGDTCIALPSELEITCDCGREIYITPDVVIASRPGF